MNRLEKFLIWLDDDCPKPIRWLVYTIFVILGLVLHVILLALVVSLGVFCFEIIPDKLQVLGGVWATIIELFFVFPLFLAIFYGIILLYLKIFNNS